jgi:Helicase conserved C-terminal domain
MRRQLTGEQEYGASLLPHQAEFIEQFFADPTDRGHLLQSDAGLGRSFMVVQLIKRMAETRPDSRVLLFAPKMLLMKMRHDLTKNGIDAEVIDRFRYRELQDAALADDQVWPTSGVFLLTREFARQGDIAVSLAAVRWSLLVVLEAHLLRGLGEETIRELVASSPDLRVVLITLPDVEGMPTFGLDHLKKSEWRRARVLGHVGQRLIVQAPVHLEVINFQQNAAERQVQDMLQNVVDLVRTTDSSSIKVATFLRPFSSSPLAAEETVRRLRNHVVNGASGSARTQVERENDDDADSLLGISDKGDTRLMEALTRCLAGLESLSTDSKLNALIERLADWQNHGAFPEAVCILTEYRSSLFYLQTTLEQIGLPSYLLHGSMSFDERSRTVLEFKERRGVLIATSAIAASGLDLPQLDVLIFYDLPRSLSMLHQLLGRFWRLSRTIPLDAIVFFRSDDMDPMANAILAKLQGLVEEERRVIDEFA